MADADEDMEIIEEIKHKPATAEEIWGDTSCSFCSKKLTTIESDPKLLTCLHAACMNCIQSNAVGDNVTCPGCSQVCQLNDIVDHQFVIELKQGSSSNSEAEKNVTCSCGDNAQAFSYCKDCQDWLCDECVSAHQRVRFTKDHVIKNKEEIDVSDVNGRQVAGQPRYLQCPTHKNELLKLYCESCDKLTCRDCQLVEHKDHKYQFLSNVSQQYKSFLTTLLTKIREKSSYIDSAQALVKKRQAEILEREDEVTKEIKVFAVQIITLINQRGKQLLQELHETCEKKKDQLTVKNEELVNLSLKLEHCLKFADSAVKESSDSALVYSKKHITNQLRHVLHKRCEVPNPQHVVDIRFMYDSKYLPEYINKVGQIVVDQQSNNRTGNRSLNQGGSAAPFIQKPPSYVGFGQQPNQAPTQTSPQRRPSPPVHYNQGRGVPAQGYQANKPYTPRANQNIHDLNKSRSQVINYQQIRPRMQQHQSPRLQSQHSQVTAPQQQQQPQQHRQQPVHSNSSVTILPVSSANNANVPNGFQQRNDSNVRIVNVQSLQARNIRQQSPQQVTPKVISVTSMSTNQMQSRPLNNMSLSMTNTQRLTHYSGNNNSAAMLQQNVQPSPSRHQSPQQSRVGQPQQLRVLELGKNANASAMMQQKAPAQTNLVNQRKHPVPAVSTVNKVPKACSLTPLASKNRIVPQLPSQVSSTQDDDDDVKIIEEKRTGLPDINSKAAEALRELHAYVEQSIGNINEQKTPSKDDNKEKSPKVMAEEDFNKMVKDKDNVTTMPVIKDVCTLAVPQNDGVQESAKKPVVTKKKTSKKTSVPSPCSTDQDEDNGTNDKDVGSGSDVSQRGGDSRSDAASRDSGIDEIKPTQEFDPNEDWCAVCHDGGDLLCCSTCPRVYHHKCHVPNISDTPSDDWSCNLCRNVVNSCFPSTKKRKSGMTNKDHAICERVLLEAFCFNSSAAFHVPVSEKLADYHEIITHPMDFTSMKKKLKSEEYESIENYVKDLKLIFENCYTYNLPNSQLSINGKKTEEFIRKKLHRLAPHVKFELTGVKVPADARKSRESSPASSCSDGSSSRSKRRKNWAEDLVQLR